MKLAWTVFEGCDPLQSCKSTLPTTGKELAARKFIKFIRNTKIATGRNFFILSRFNLEDLSRSANWTTRQNCEWFCLKLVARAGPCCGYLRLHVEWPQKAIGVFGCRACCLHRPSFGICRWQWLSGIVGCTCSKALWWCEIWPRSNANWLIILILQFTLTSCHISDFVFIDISARDLFGEQPRDWNREESFEVPDDADYGLATR